MPYRTVAFFCILLGVAPAAPAQTYTAAADILFYGDNTEFANRFRKGETLLGVSGRIFLAIAINDRVTLRGGLFGLGRFGSHEFLEHGEPMIALEIARGPSRFIFGSLETTAWRHDIRGPDEDTPHGLLPPLQQETLTFTRGQEMGLQWLVEGHAVDHDAWINWQRLNTSEHRERLDAGYRAGVQLHPALELRGQWHVVHEGGQQFRRGPVSESQGGALGLQWSRGTGSARVTLDGHAVATRDVPDRDQPATTEAGIGVFARAAVERGTWRSHAIVWRSRDTVKAEGDANYLAAQTDGLRFRKIRDYAEVGLTRHFRPAAGVHVLAAIRLHRVESTYEYSYRIAGRVQLRHTVRSNTP
jgi:hypothetical protein